MRNLPSLILAFMVLTQHTSGASSFPREAEVDRILSDFSKPNTPGAAVAIIQDGKTLLQKGYGMASLEKGSRCESTTDFRLASMTKQFTAACVLLLAQEKKLSLDEPLTAFFPEFPAYGKQITVRHLLHHTSGLLDYEDLIPKGTTLPVLDRDVLRLLIKQDHTQFKPGERFEYSNSGYSILSLIVETRSGMPFPRFLKTRIFEPLKMRGTLAYEQGFSVIPNRACGYSSEANAFKQTDQSLTSSVLGDGGIYSSVTDLAKWDAALYGGKVLPRSLIAQAFEPGPKADAAGNRYGCGWFINQYRGLKEIWHSGNTMGFTSRILRFPEKKFAVVILANRSDASLAEPARQIVDMCLFNGIKPPNEMPVPPDPTK
jgi:CubicO group peptidase (beta-lactamase class C family)